MSGYSNQWVTLTSEALRARRDEERRRRRRRRRLTGLAVLVLAAVIAGGVVLVSWPGAHAARAAHRLTRGAMHSRLVHPRSNQAEVAALTVAWENMAIDHLLARQPFIKAGGAERREIALTFDDGPGPYTSQLLQILHRLHAPGTFFEVGFMFRWFGSAAARAVRDGEVLGDHTEMHPRMTRLSPAAQRSQILEQTRWLRSIGAAFPRLWRPPYGLYNAATLAVLRQLHMLMVLWTVDSQDYLRPGAGVIVRRVLAGARPGAIILMHDGGGDRIQTIKALPFIVHALRKRGYVLVTVPRLILDDPPLSRQVLPAHLPGD